MSDWSPASRRLYQACMGIVRLCAAIVPRHRRREWRREWEGELWHRVESSQPPAAGRIPAGALLARSLGALPHAFSERQHPWRLEPMWQDLQYALRAMLARPGFTLLVVLTLGAGIGANTAMFSVVNSILLRPLAYPHADQLVYMYGAFGGGQNAAISPPDFLDYRERNTSFQSIAAGTLYGRGGSAVVGGEPEPERVNAAIVTADFFSTLGVVPLLGRAFVRDDEEGSGDVVILSHGLWQRRFGGDPAIVGRSVQVDGRAHEVIGVMPEVLDRTLPHALWRPVRFHTPQSSTRRFHYLRGIGRLRPGVTLAMAQQQMDAVAASLAATYPENEGWHLRLVPYREVVVGRVETALTALLASVGLVLLIACGNVASLLLARATARSGEVAVRAALGASRGRIIRQLLTESLALGLASGLVGTGLAFLGVKGVRVIAADILPRISELAIDGRVLAFAAVLSLATSVLFGLAPALHATRGGLLDALRLVGRSSAGVRGTRGRDALVVAQVALSLVLLAGAGLLLRSLWRLQQVPTGFDKREVVAAPIALLSARYPSRAEQVGFWQQLLDRAGGLPGVDAAAVTSMLPLRGGGDTYYYVEGKPPASDADRRNAQVNSVSDAYFETMRIPLVAGRPFSRGEGMASAGQGTMIVSASMARRLFEGRPAVGARLVVDFGTPFTGEIIGVASDVRAFGPTEDAPDIMYFPFSQRGSGFSLGVMHLVVRTRADASATGSALRRTLHDLDPELPLQEVSTMSEIVDSSMAEERLRARFLGAFAGFALLLVVVGLYGVLAYAVTMRSREIGVRVALGAANGSVFAMIIRRGMLLVGLGVVLGLVGALGVARVVRALLFEVSATDPWVLGSVTVLLAGAGLAACVVPALRATRVNPAVILRE